MELNSYIPAGCFPEPPAKALLDKILETAASRPGGLLKEHEAYEIFKIVGFGVPDFVYIPVGEIESASEKIGDKKYVAKCDIPGCLHKSDIGGVVLNVTKENVNEVLKEMVERLGPKGLEGILLCEMVSFFGSGPTGGELLLSALADPAFGPCVCLGFGGTSVEYLKDIMRPGKSVLFLPTVISPYVDSAHPDECTEIPSAYKRIFKNSPVIDYLTGKVRGIKPQTTEECIMDAIRRIHRIVHYYSVFNPNTQYIIEELEINPCVVSKEDGKIIALDAVFRAKKQESKKKNIPLYTAPKSLDGVGALLKPKSVCIIGASARSLMNPCSVVLQNFLATCDTDSGVKKDNIYLIHPQASEILGVPAYKTMEEILEKRGGEEIDLFVVGIRAALAVGVMMEAFQKKFCKSIFILSGGFGETEDGKEADEKLHKFLAEWEGPRPVINGPNTLGNVYFGGANTNFVGVRKTGKIILTEENFSKNITNGCLICQSGACMISRLSNMGKRAAPSMCVSVGNQLDLSATDMLEYTLEHADELHHFDAYALYIEGLNPLEGPRLMHLVTEAKNKNKLVVVYKSGRSKQGSDAAKGHTASIAGDYSYFKSMLEQAGAVVADSFGEFEETFVTGMIAPSLVKNIRAAPKGKHITIGCLTNAGFEKCSMADNLFIDPEMEQYLQLPEVTPSVKKTMDEEFAKCGLKGVVDFSPILDTTPTISDDKYDYLLGSLMDICNCEIGLMAGVPETGMIKTLDSRAYPEDGDDILNDDSVIARTIKLAEDKLPQGKTVLACLDSGWRYEATAAHLVANGVMTFRSADNGCRCIAKIVKAMRIDAM